MKEKNRLTKKTGLVILGVLLLIGSAFAYFTDHGYESANVQIGEVNIDLDISVDERGGLVPGDEFTIDGLITNNSDGFIRMRAIYVYSVDGYEFQEGSYIPAIPTFEGFVTPLNSLLFTEMFEEGQEWPSGGSFRYEDGKVIHEIDIFTDLGYEDAANIGNDVKFKHRVKLSEHMPNEFQGKEVRVDIIVEANQDSFVGGRPDSALKTSSIIIKGTEIKVLPDAASWEGK